MRGCFHNFLRNLCLNIRALIFTLQINKSNINKIYILNYLRRWALQVPITFGRINVLFKYIIFVPLGTIWVKKHILSDFWPYFYVIEILSLKIGDRNLWSRLDKMLKEVSPFDLCSRYWNSKIQSSNRHVIGLTKYIW